MLKFSRASFRRACNAVIAKTGFGENYLRSKLNARQDLHAFWMQRSPKGNDPKDYLKPIPRSAALLKLIDQPKEAKILEVGRNLAYLHNAGYTNVEGVEINEHAVRLLRENYPQLAGSTIHTGPAEEILPSLS